MNYLAHAYLSFYNPPLLAGQMISDFVKGKQQYTYHEAIQKGIRLHRAIDAFTDAHPATHAAIAVFKPHVGRYGGAFVDIAYDYFLANDVRVFPSPNHLAMFATDTYALIAQEQSALPSNFVHLFGYMQSQNWLYNYRLHEGIEKSFAGLVRRAQFLDTHLAVFDSFLEHQQVLQQCYNVFVDDVRQFAQQFLQ